MVKPNYKRPSNLRSTLGLVLALIAISLISILQIEAIIEKSCFQTLNDTVEQGATHIRAILESGEQQMRGASDMLADHTALTTETCPQYLAHLHTGGLISSYSILLPDGQMVYAHDAAVQVNSVPDFDTESREPARFVSRYEGIIDDKYAAYISPIVKDGTPVGVLYGYVRLSDLPEQFAFSAFGGQCHLYLVDGSTGDFLMDTWHDSLGNMYDDYLSHRKTKLGTSFEQMRKNVENETSGYVVFESKTVGEDFYSCYYPVQKYRLSFQVTVPRSVAFAEAVHIQKIVFVFGLMQFTVVVIYVLFLLWKARQRDHQAQKELALNRAMSEVQRTLFGVYKKPYLVDTALKMLEHAIGSDQIVLLLLNDGVTEEFFSLPAADDQEKERVIGKKLPDIVLQDIGAQLEKKGLTLDAESDRERLEQVTVMPGLQITEAVHNLVCVWVLNSQKDIIGLMYAVNVDEPESSQEALATVVGSFQLAIQALASYNLLYQMGEFDAMTGLKNRNAYQKDLNNLESMQKDRLCCIYLDANGLHDINNCFGHARGDQMLNCIGSMVRELFGFENSYRIGGDEFVIFCTELDESIVQERIQLLQSRLEELEYYVSAGFAFWENGQRIQQMIVNAETKMYEQKKAFYTGDQKKIRKHNQELEDVLIAKKDQESFLSAIAANYLGVYAVNLDTNITRSIYNPKYFDEILKKTDYYYQSAIHEYARQFVSDEDYENFMCFLDYEQIKREISAGHILECYYGKKNGDIVRARILPMEGYSTAQKDTLWIFEKCSVVDS